MNLDFKILTEEKDGDRIVMKCQWAQGFEFSFSRDYSAKPVSEIQGEVQTARTEAQAKATDLHARYVAAQSA